MTEMKKMVYSHLEREVFEEVVINKKVIHTNNTLRGASSRDVKTLAWNELVEECNSIQGVTKRILPQESVDLPDVPHLLEQIPQTSLTAGPPQEAAKVQPRRSRSNVIQGEIKARCNRVNNQMDNDNEVPMYLVKKIKAEAELAEFQLSCAKADEERRKISFEEERAFLAEKRKVELEMLRNK